jgi:hypothetical protein
VTVGAGDGRAQERMLLVRDHPEHCRYEAILDDMVVGVLEYAELLAS